MGTVLDQINETEAYQTHQREQQQAERQARAQSEMGSVEVAVDPVLDMEKSDAMFWLQVATVVLLVLIWRELRRS